MNIQTAGSWDQDNLSVTLSDIPAGVHIHPDAIAGDLRRLHQIFYSADVGNDEVCSTLRSKIASTSVTAEAFVCAQFPYEAFAFEGGIVHDVTTGAPIVIRLKNPLFDTRNYPIGTKQHTDDTPRLIKDIEAYRARLTLPSYTLRAGSPDAGLVARTDSEDAALVQRSYGLCYAALRVLAASVAREILAKLGVEVLSYVYQVGSITLPDDSYERVGEHKPLEIEMSALRMPDAEITRDAKKLIEVARVRKEGLGGAYRVFAWGVDAGLGDVSVSERLDAQIAARLMAVGSARGVELGLGQRSASTFANEAHDELTRATRGFERMTNHAGGTDVGVSSGMPLVFSVSSAAPFESARGLATLTLDGSDESSDVPLYPICTIASEAVWAESELAIVLAERYLKRFGSIHISETVHALHAYRARTRALAH